MAENFSKINDRHQTPDQEGQRSPSRLNIKKSSPRYIVFKLQKIKDKEIILKEARRKKILPVEEQG